ncbi:MAG: hypothetical protein KF782_22710 [Labilithrix sp.]|nr:hypothetical protein [Labilithrix sp.]
MVAIGRRHASAARALRTEVFAMAIKLTLFHVVSNLAACAALTAVAAGCGADAGADDEDTVSSEDAILASSIVGGTFKLYGEPNAAPNPHCDVHTALTLSGDGGARAALREALDGLCEIYVAPQEREYRLRLAGTSCGSKIYKGKKRIAGKVREITITDHRTRVCRDLVPAKIIVAETDGAGALQTKYSFDGPPPAPPATSTWLTIAPKQCGTNPWNGAQPAPGQDPSHLQGEAGEVHEFFRGQGIGLEQIGFAYPAEPMMVCMACSCPRGDTLVVRATSSADAQRLVTEYGFAPIEDALTRAPTQCGTNPWQGGQQLPSDADEAHQLASWAAGAGAPLSAAGFLDSTEPRFVCMACSCPRGDLAIAFPADAASSTNLEGLGFTRIED